MTNRYEEASEAARGLLADFDEIDLAEIAATTAKERDGAYRERAQLLALLAALHPSVIAPAPDVAEDGWQILYLRIGGRQASWHIAPRDAELYAHVEHVPTDDRRAQWDGHTTEQKYARIGQHAARLYADARSRVDTPLTPAEAAIARVHALADRWANALAPDLAYARALRAALDEPAPGPEATQATDDPAWLHAGTRDLGIPEHQHRDRMNSEEQE